MDVATGAPNLQIPKLGWIAVRRRTFAAALALAAALTAPARAVLADPLHFFADKQVWDRKANRVDLIGHAVVSQEGETVMADRILLDQKNRTLDATGACTYVTADTVVQGDEIQLNIDTRTGSITRGRVSSDSFTLSGERINKLSGNRYQTHWGEYTTCRDCPQSWSLVAQDVDLEFEGYVVLKNVVTKIKDAPAMWLPILALPVKTKRQSGFLAPTSLSFSALNGVTAVIPFYWATSKSTDMTFAAGGYSSKGERFTWEGRYRLTSSSDGQANVYYLRDVTFPDFPYRWAVDVRQTQKLPWGLVEKLRVQEIGDNLYPYFVGDVGSVSEPTLGTVLSLSYSSNLVSGYVTGKRIRSLVNTNPDPVKQRMEFDPRTVQVLPGAEINISDFFPFGGPLGLALNLGATNFTRPLNAFDYDDSSIPFGTQPSGVGPAFRPGTDPIRKAIRFSANPTAYLPIRPLGLFSLVPSVELRSLYYTFPQTQPYVQDLARSYLLFRTDFSAQAERIYEFDDPEIPRAKHLIRPVVSYSLIPWVMEDSNHPFLQQFNARATTPGYKTGYNFDNQDIVPIDANSNNLNYYIPLGHSLTYGLSTQWIRKRYAVDGTGSGSYQTAWEITSGQAINFRDPSQPFTRLFTNWSFGYDKIGFSGSHLYYPYISAPKNAVSASVSWLWERGIHQRILAFERSFSLGYTYNRILCTNPDYDPECGTSNISAGVKFSLSDYILPSASISYGLLTLKPFSYSVGLIYQSLSQCYRISGAVSFQSGRPGLDVKVNFDLNLDGSGFGGLSAVASR